MRYYNPWDEVEQALLLPSEAEIQQASCRWPEQKAVEPVWADEGLERLDTPAEASLAELRRLIQDACGYECLPVEQPLPLQSLAKRLAGLGYARAVPFHRDALLSAVQEGAYVLLYLSHPRTCLEAERPLEGGASWGCRVLAADEEGVTLRDCLLGACRQISFEELELLYPHAQMLEVYK